MKAAEGEDKINKTEEVKATCLVARVYVLV
jgi:hypothetical protein